LKGEEALIASYWQPLTNGDPGALGLQDDCAIIALPAGEELIVTTDALVSGVHFFPDEDAGAVAWKALAVNVSDLVAKGATPKSYVMNIALPAFDAVWLEKFAAGLSEAQTAFGCHLIGGDTDRTPGPLSVSITAFGSVPAGKMIPRSGGLPGQDIFVTGTIGDAALGLDLRKDPAFAPLADLSPGGRKLLVESFNRPRPPLALVPALRGCASAAMDVSDGLIKDLARLCRASGVGVRIEAARVPLSLPAEVGVRAGVSLEHLLSGGEDYQVLFCAERARRPEIMQWTDQFGVRTTRIGEITAADSVVFVNAAGGVMKFAQSGWDHFQDSETR
jgi:thiamine-monophosphate kinase